MCDLGDQLKDNGTFLALKKHAQKAHTHRSKGHTWVLSVQQFGSIKHHLDLFMLNLLDMDINPAKYGLSIIQWFNYLQHHDNIMDGTHYWPFAREYSIWNSTVTALQFWMADHEPHILSNAIERVYTAFFCHSSAQHLRNISEEILCSHFVTTLSDTFKWELVQDDEGYKSGSKSLSIPTPLRRALQIYHVSTSENISFDPATPQLSNTQNTSQENSEATALYAAINIYQFWWREPCCNTWPMIMNHSMPDDRSLQGGVEFSPHL